MNLESTLWLLGGTLVPSLLIAWSAAFVVRGQAARWGLIDKPNERKVHVAPTPLGGGLAIWLGVIGPFAAGTVLLLLAAGDDASGGDSWLLRLIPEFARPHLPGLVERLPTLWLLLGAGTVLMIVGLIDDRRGLDWKIRLAVQFVVAASCVAWQGWRLTVFIDWPLVTGTLSVLWIVALINSFNMLDNMDGLSGGVAAIAGGVLAAVMLLTPDPEAVGDDPQFFVAGFLLVIVGALLGFLIHNRPPARLFMGDAGSYFVGFSIAVATLLATYAGYQSASRHAVLAPVCVMAVPLYDMVTVLWIRLREGRSPFQADKSHFSHRLVDLGLSKGQAVLTIYLTTATCGLGALLLHRVDAIGAAIIVLMILCVLALIAILESTARGKLKRR
jgi:UDP-GlcNAc:undecaprenyl-phosphate GlcNAc-1-phosphate transferase